MHSFYLVRPAGFGGIKSSSFGFSAPELLGSPLLREVVEKALRQPPTHNGCPKRVSRLSKNSYFLVGDTGFEPVTSSVSGKMSANQVYITILPWVLKDVRVEEWTVAA